MGVVASVVAGSGLDVEVAPVEDGSGPGVADVPSAVAGSGLDVAVGSDVLGWGAVVVDVFLRSAVGASAGAFVTAPRVGDGLASRPARPGRVRRVTDARSPSVGTCP